MPQADSHHEIEINGRLYVATVSRTGNLIGLSTETVVRRIFGSPTNIATSRRLSLRGPLARTIAERLGLAA